MERLGFYFDMGRCIGCKTCQVACKDKHNLETDDFFRRVVTVPAEQDDPVQLCYYSIACNHCMEPACVEACSTGAMHRREDGTVGHSPGECIGCGACMWSCPYSAPKLNKVLGISQKCDACADLRSHGKNPACVDACITHCLKFGDLDKMEQAYGPGLEHQYPALPDKGNTRPSLLIKKRPCRKGR